MTGAARQLASYACAAHADATPRRCAADACRSAVAKLEDRKIVCAFKFGLTEIEVTATNASGEKSNHKLSFNI